MLQHYSDNVDRVVRAQSAWRGAIARRRFRSVVRRAQEADRARLESALLSVTYLFGIGGAVHIAGH